MAIPIVVVEFADVDPDATWLTLQRNEALGYFAHNAERQFALVLGSERLLNALQRTEHLVKKVTVRDPGPVLFANFTTLKRIHLPEAPFGRPHLSFDSVTSHGKIRGWLHLPSGKPCVVTITIDGEPAGEVPANAFREDLLEAGVGEGVTSFMQRLPDRFLDGGTHHIVLEAVHADNRDGPVVLRQQRKLRLPFHFHLNRPWMGNGDSFAYNWTRETEKELQDVRAEILHGNYEVGMTRAEALITDHPRAVFHDLGVRERKMQDGAHFETFDQKINNRWGHLFGETLCERGAECCKNLRLSYNPKAIRRESGPSPIESERPWAPKGLLDKCPLKIRHFASKTLTQDFAREIGVKVPKTYATIRTIAEFDAFDFPERYVLKPDFGSGIYLFLMHGEINLFDGFTYTHDEIRARVAQHLAESSHAEFVVEEFITQQGVDPSRPIIPLDYKIHSFGGRARFIQAIDKNTISRDALHQRQNWLSRDWTQTPFPIRFPEPPNDPVNPPECYEELLRVADDIAARLGDYVRVDLYASDEGPMLGEVTSFTNAGKGFSEYGNMILGQTWEIFNDWCKP